MNEIKGDELKSLNFRVKIILIINSDCFPQFTSGHSGDKYISSVTVISDEKYGGNPLVAAKSMNDSVQFIF